jgi:hypothetical protein
VFKLIDELTRQTTLPGIDVQSADISVGYFGMRRFAWALHLTQRFQPVIWHIRNRRLDLHASRAGPLLRRQIRAGKHPEERRFSRRWKPYDSQLHQLIFISALS